MTLHEPYDVNHRRAPAIASSPWSRQRPSSTSGTRSSRIADHVVGARAVEREPGREQHVDEAVVLEAVGAGVPQGVVQPGRALERRLPVERGVDPRGQGGRGREQVRLQPAGAELQPQLGLGHRVGGAQPGRTRLLLGELDVHRRLVVEHAVRPGGVDRGHHAAGVAGQVVEVAQRDLEAGHVGAVAAGEVQRAADRAGTAGDHDRQRDAAPRPRAP